MITGNEAATALIKNSGLISEGLTIRQHFAAMAFAACRSTSPGLSADIIAAQAVKDADALIQALNNE